MERNTSGKVVSEKWTTAPQPGDNVVLTIDIDLQKQVEDISPRLFPSWPVRTQRAQPAW